MADTGVHKEDLLEKGVLLEPWDWFLLASQRRQITLVIDDVSEMGSPLEREYNVQSGSQGYLDSGFCLERER